MIVLPWNNLLREALHFQIDRAIGASHPAPLTGQDGLFPGSSAVEHPTVNRTADGSNPSRGATFLFKMIMLWSAAL